MKVLVIGSGGREHALVWKITQSALVDEVFCAPGNGGTAEIASNIAIAEDDPGALINFAKKEKIDLTIVGPEAPLVRGIANSFRSEGLRLFGPTKNAAMLEGSKAYAKILMQQARVRHASFELFHNAKSALSYIKSGPLPAVIKASGLAAGKGVIIVRTQQEAEDTIKEIMIEKRFGKAGETILIEEFLKGEEVSLLVLTDGETILPFVTSQDHQQAYDNDEGPNTGGMGAYAPAPVLGEEATANIVDTVLRPVISALKKEGVRYKGVLYAGLMIGEGGAKVLEFNCRFGDPETQAILPLLKSDLFEALLMTANGELHQTKFEWMEGSAVCVVLASGGYPGKYEKGKVIQGLDDLRNRSDVIVFHAGTKRENGRLLTAGGRVLGVTGMGNDLTQAIATTYAAIESISFDALHFRKDIGQKGLNRKP
jgi:phosphoribosylamine--glycine ligase